MVEKGYGSWSEVNEIDPFTRMAIWYTSVQLGGWEVDWNSGTLKRPKNG